MRKSSIDPGDGTSRTSAKRRTLLKASIAGAAAAPVVLTTRRTEAQVVLPPSPPTTPWVQELALSVPPMAPFALDPPPSTTANTVAGECGRAEHQRYAELCVPGKAGTPVLYQLTAKENPAWVFNPAYPPQPIWGYAGGADTVAVSPGPMIHARYGQSVILRIHNALPQDHVGFGSPEISTHLHNMHTPSESDGFAGDFYSATQRGLTLGSPGTFSDHFYPNLYAGFDEQAQMNPPGNPLGDPREALGSLFYHDHAEGVTAPNVLKGLFGRYNLYDELDSGNETDPNPAALRLPSGNFDYPLSLGDRRFDVSGRVTFDELNPEGVLGDKVVVNGKIEPVLRVARRKYRFRILNAGPVRFYELVLQNAGGNTLYTFAIIGNDGNLLPNALGNQSRVRIAPAERTDIVINFAAFPAGTVLYLVNQLVQLDTRQPANVQAPGTRVLRFQVDGTLPATDPSRVPSALRPLRPLPNLANVPVRTFAFARQSGNWTINNQLFNSQVPRLTVNRGAEEIWEFVNVDNGWQHPIHVHFEEGRIISKTLNGVNVPIPPNEQGRKDVFVLGPLATVRVFFRFRDFQGKYMMHCHNLTHEDHAMMLRYDIS